MRKHDRLFFLFFFGYRKYKKGNYLRVIHEMVIYFLFGKQIFQPALVS